MRRKNQLHGFLLLLALLLCSSLDARAGGIFQSLLLGETPGAAACISGNDATTTLLVHSNTTEGSVSFIDTGRNAACPHTVTPSNHAHHTTTQHKWGKSSIAFDGTDDYLTVTHGGSFDWRSAATPLTIDLWINFSSLVPNQCIIAQAGQFSLSYFNSGIRIALLDVATTKDWAWTPTVGVWYWLVVVRNIQNQYTPYVDGVALGELLQDSNPGTSTDITIGKTSTYGTYFNGYMDEIRFSNAAKDVSSVPEHPYCD